MKHLLSVLICILLLSGLIVHGGHVLRSTGTDSTVDAIASFQSLPENTLDVIAFGSSHAWNGVNAPVLLNEYGISCFNYSGPWQRINTTSAFLADALLSQRPKVVLIETLHINEVLIDVEIEGELSYSRALRPTEEKRLYLEQCFQGAPGRYISYALPFFRYHGNWASLSKESFTFDKDGRNALDAMGYVGLTGTMPAVIGDCKTFPQEPLGEAARTILDRMVSACKSQNIDIVFFTTPFSGEYAYIQAVEAYAAENGCRYLNFFALFDACGLDAATDFYDGGHLNADGSAKLTRYLGDYLTAHYGLAGS